MDNYKNKKSKSHLICNTSLVKLKLVNTWQNKINSIKEEDKAFETTSEA
jgi:hypothetical protein